MSAARAPRVPSYRLHRPTGLAVVRLNGKDIYLGKHGTPESHQQYERRIGEWLTNSRRPEGISSPSTSVSSDLTVDELIVAFMDHVSRYYMKLGQPTSSQQHIRDALRPLHDW